MTDPTPADFRAIGQRLSNWGRWGDDDVRGTLNFLTPELVLASLRSARSGRTFELSIPLGKDGPHTQLGLGVRVNPVHLMGIMPGDLDLPDGVLVTDDYVVMPLQAATQWDGFAHLGYDDHFYNGVPSSSVTATQGALHNGIDRTLPGFVGRGVLLDIARLDGTSWLPIDRAIGPEDLEAAERAQGVRLGRGDALLVRTGWRRKAVVEGWDGWLGTEPGLTLDCAEWIHHRELAAVASDNWGVEVAPAASGYLPLHCVLIRDMGMMLGEMWDLEALADDCVADGHWDFHLVAPALRVTGAVGSPISPIAIK